MNDKIHFKVIFRSPEYPVIVIDRDYLYSAYNFDELAYYCVISTPPESRNIVPVLDSAGEEFWYSVEQYVVSPGFNFKKWTKKQIIELYNNSADSEESHQKYSLKSLSSKKLANIIKDVCELIGRYSQ